MLRYLCRYLPRLLRFFTLLIFAAATLLRCLMLFLRRSFHVGFIFAFHFRFDFLMTFLAARCRF